MKKEVKVYSKMGCTYCDEAKRFLEEQNIEFTEVNVEENKEKEEELIKKSGQLGVPVIEINQIIVVGFKKDEIMKLL